MAKYLVKCFIDFRLIWMFSVFASVQNAPVAIKIRMILGLFYDQNRAQKPYTFRENFFKNLTGSGFNAKLIEDPSRDSSVRPHSDILGLDRLILVLSADVVNSLAQL